MENIHLRISETATLKLMEFLNEISKDGEQIEILDDTLFRYEKNLIEKAISQKAEHKIVEHNKVWNELLD